MQDIEESILDVPREEGLDSSLWTVKEDGTYTLTSEAKDKIMFIIKWMTQNESHPLNSFGVNIVGSMTSNSYSDTSDIDLHFNSMEVTEDEAEEFNKTFRADFDENFKDMFEESDWKINGHPIEVYFQSNPVQDLMSVGCYDVLKDEWKVGPEIKDTDFDPYAEYYHEDMKYIQDVISDIRNVILQCFESAIAIRNSEDEGFRKFETQYLVDRLAKAAKIFTDAREYRKVKSSPRTEEQAKSYRISRDWKIADSAFKLLDKFGYLSLLRTMTQCYELLGNGELSQEEVVETIIKAVKENFSSNVNLDENQICVYEDLQNEGLKDIVKYAMLMGALALPISNVEGGQKGDVEKNIPRQELNTLNKMVGDMSYSNTLNCVAWTLWTEASGEYREHGIASLNAIASVIWNRSNQDPERFSKEIGRPLQFSWWNDYTGGFTEGTYVPQSPTEKELKNPTNKKIWEICNEIANKMMERKFHSTIGKLNAYMNKKTADKKNVDSWGKKCNYKLGKHSFGYLSEWDGAKKYGKKNTQNVAKTVQKTHVIQSGDTLAKIAKKYNTTAEQILKNNTFIKDANKIKIGWKLKV